VLSWNVHGLSLNKLEDTDFLNILVRNDIVFLYESWTSSTSEINIPGYVVHNFFRRFQHKNAKRSSGGIVLCIKESLKNGIKIVKNHQNSIIWLQLDHGFFHVEKDIFVCGVYLWGEDSPAYNTIDIDFFQLIEQDVDYFKTLGSVHVTGDFNSRVGHKHDFIILDKTNEHIDDTDYVPDAFIDRASLDGKCNAFGTKLLDLCKSSGLRIANGRIGDDYDTGAFTFVSAQGTSVVDYLLTQYDEFSGISNFNIQPLNEWSDHTPIYFSLCVNNKVVSPDFEPELRYCWNDDYKAYFRTCIIGMLPVFNDMCYNIDSASQNGINRLIHDFTSTIREIADPLFTKYTDRGKNKYGSSSGVTSLIRNKEWFDDACMQAKQRYLESRRVFNQCHNDESRKNFCECKQIYKKIVQVKKREFKLNKMKELENLRHSRPKEFWKYFSMKNRSKSSRPGSEISLHEFFKYFSNLEKDIFQTSNEQSEDFRQNHDFDHVNFDEELDFQITFQEIERAVKKLKCNKAYGIDCLLNEYFIHSVDILAPFLCDIFNAILDSGYFPDQWREGIIVPLHKKGDKSDVGNYRGITLLSCLSKLFTSILNERIVAYCEKYNCISDAQFGFKKGHSTIDAIFSLHTIIQHYLNNKKRLYVAFIDLKKCFDSIYRNGLFFKLHKSGIDGKVLRIIKSMYENIKSCVKHCNNFSDFFEYAIGLRQGEVISPVLVSLFLEDIELFLQERIESGLTINDITLILMLFADDMAILGNTPEDLQNSLDLLHKYCLNWGLEVNSEKTKIMVFRKRGGLLHNEKWTYDGKEVEVVESFNYLGTVFSYSGHFGVNNEHLVGKAVKALNVLLINCKKIPLKPRILCQLFDSFIGAILNYSSEIWGFTKSKELERIHLKFCKRLLHVRLTSCTLAVYGELARYPLYISRYCRIMKYWCKVKDSDNIILKKTYELGLSDHENGKINWVSNVKKLLDDYGFSDVFSNFTSYNVKSFLLLFKQRVIDCFKQSWYGGVLQSSVLYEYKSFKETFEYEMYLDLLPNNLRLFITRFRISAHSLRINTGRFGRTSIPRNERYCLCCDKYDIEDNFHFICICSRYSVLRSKYIPKLYYQRPSVFKFNNLMSSIDNHILYKLAIFLKLALAERTKYLNMVT